MNMNKHLFFFFTRGLCPSSQEKILCFKTLSMENCRLLMHICSNARDIPMMHSMCPLKPLPCIYWGESLKSMKFPLDSSSVAQIHRPIKLEKLWR